MLTATSTTGQPPSPCRLSRAACAASLILTALWCAFWFMHARGFWEDDAWIHLEFARSVAHGQGFAFNGRVVAGDTAPLWVLLLAAMHAFVPWWLAAGKLLAVSGALFGFTGIYAFARRIARDLLRPQDRDVFASATVLLVAVNPYTCYWIFSGMEPLTAAGLACWAALAATRDRPTLLSFLTACLLAGLGPLLRPEMFFLALLLAVPLCGQWRRLHASPPVKFACAVAGVLLLAGPLLAWLLYSLDAFGQLLPNTNAAKRAAPGDSVLRRLVSIYGAGLPLVFAGAAAGAVHSVLHPSGVLRSLRSAFGAAARISPDGFTLPAAAAIPNPRRTLPFIGWLFVLWAAMSSIFYLADHTFVQTRYILVSAPALTVVILAVALARWPRYGRWLCAATLTAGTTVSLIVVVPFLRNKSQNCATVRQIAHFLHDRLSPDAPVAVYSIGQIAFESEHPIVDTGGITRPGAVLYFNAPIESMAHWAESQGAQYYISSDAPDRGAVPIFTVEAPFLGWTFDRSRFAQSAPIGVWKLPAQSAPTQQAQNAAVASTQP